MQLGKTLRYRKKICFIVTKGVWGGAQKYVYALATELPKNKYDVFVIVGAGNILKSKLEEQSIRVYEIDSLKRDISFFSEIKNFIKIFNIVRKENPTILHLNSPKASGIGALIGRLLLTPKIIQTVHGWSFNENRNIFSRSLIYLLSWITTILCTHTIVIGKSEKTQALKMPFVGENKISLIKNGISNIKYIDKQIVRTALLHRVGKSLADLETNTTWIGTLSELHPNKGLKYTINALSKISSPFVFFVIGEGEEREKLKDLILEKELQNKVFLVGFIDIANLYYKAFDIFTLTSVKEGLPYTLLEAGLAGLPIISSSVGGIPDIIDNKKNGLLTRKKDVKEITTSIEYLINNPKIRSEYGKKIKEKIQKEFSLDGMLKKTFALYK